MAISFLPRAKRLIADLPGVLPFLERIARRAVRTVITPDGDRILVNSLFHSSLATPESLAGYEPKVRTALHRLVQPGMTVYDIGANVGVFTLLCARLVGQAGMVYAFEPEPNNLRYLGQTIRNNALPNVHLDPRAIGRTTGTEHFDRRGGAFSGRLVGENTHYHRTMNVVPMATVCLDDLVEREGYRAPDVLKIDVEGNEGLVFAGGARTLRRHRPIILCELHAHLGERMTDTTDQLRSYDYQLFGLDGLPLREPTKDREHIVAYVPAPGAVSFAPNHHRRSPA